MLEPRGGYLGLVGLHEMGLYAVNRNVRFKSLTFSRKYETEHDSRTGGSFEAKYSTSSTL